MIIEYLHELTKMVVKINSDRIFFIVSPRADLQSVPVRFIEKPIFVSAILWE